MKYLKRISIYFMCVLLTLSSSMTSFATDTDQPSTVTYTGRDKLFEFAPGSYYTETDLFDNLAGIMPGDTKTETVTVINKYRGCDYINVHLGMLLHDEKIKDPQDPNKEIEPTNPISEKVLEELRTDNRREEKVDEQGKKMSELAYMNEFLSQLEMKVWNGEKIDKNLIYKGSPDALEVGFEKGNVFLGSLRYNKSLELNVELTLDIETGNEFADRIGEVDWVFVVSERNDSGGGGGGGGGTRPTKPSNPTGPGSEYVEVIEPDYPDAPGEDGFWVNVLPKTGDETVILPYVIVGLLALIGLIVLIVGRRKDKEE